MRNAIRAGSQRTLAMIGQPIVGRDDAGAEVIAWQEKAAWINIEPFSGKEWATFAAIKDGMDCRITVHRIPGWVPMPRWRFREADTGAIYAVTAVMENPNGALIETMCRKVSSETDGR
jgi:head-tail adaptor